MNGKSQQFIVHALSLVVATLVAYIVAVSAVDGKIRTAQEPVLQAVDDVREDIRELRGEIRAILISGGGRIP